VSFVILYPSISASLQTYALFVMALRVNTAREDEDHDLDDLLPMEVSSMLGYDCTFSPELRRSQVDLSSRTHRPCVCQGLHDHCQPSRCITVARMIGPARSPTVINAPKFGHDVTRTQIKLLRRSADEGCVTCAVIYDGLHHPRLYDSRDPGQQKETITSISPVEQLR
jgi:hypothetical protein